MNLKIVLLQKDYRYFLKQDEFLTITKDEKKEIIKVDKYSFKMRK